jgi:hypothetical protein
MHKCAKVTVKHRCRDIARTFSYTTDLEIEVDCCLVGCRCLLNREQQWKPVSTRSNSCVWGPQCAYRYFPEDTTNTVLFGEVISMNYWNSMKIVKTVLKKVVILCFWIYLKGPYFCSENVQFTGYWPVKDTLLKIVQTLARGTSVHMHVRTYRRHTKSHVFAFGGKLITC